MKKAKTSSLVFLFLLWLFVLTAFSTISIEAERTMSSKSKMQRARDIIRTALQTVQTRRLLHQLRCLSLALLAAWKSACKVTGGVVEIPAGLKFLVKPVTLQGPCMPNLVLQIDGTLLAPPKIGSWPKASSYINGINFKWLQNFTVQGAGTADGQGSNWWSSSQNDQKKRVKCIPDMKPTALRFYEGYNVTVRDIRIINSPLCHLKFDNSKRVKVNNVTISAPESSPNTDGIHLQNSQDVEILHSDIGTGGLGKDKVVACVSNIVVENVIMQNTLYGARIKTWQVKVTDLKAQKRSVKNVTFSNIQVSDVKVPITIDQYYCDKNVCKNQTGAVAISGVTFNQIIGTYAVQPIHLACSNSIPCTDVDLISIRLEPSSQYRGFQQALCWNSYGKSLGPLAPASMDYCVRSGSDFVKRIARSHDASCW
ncbi:UNVERIFIED_CONTAM: Polygalacturonase [Sesamum calycinum]|uniref:Polygalacturonase n=1 Tax=Sesamum calycinum TaxID=2727403 RepID=A0AAW2QX57_9LAMI